MERKKLPVGIENFEEIRKEGFYYVSDIGYESRLRKWFAYIGRHFHAEEDKNK